MNELFIEIGTEELPARFVTPAAEGLAAAVVKLLGNIEHGAVQTWSTPRRIAVVVRDVVSARPLVEKLVTGPPAAAAFKDGVPTAVGEAFARARGADPRDLEVVTGPKGSVAGLRRREGGESTIDIVSAGLEAAVLSIPFKRSMRWGTSPQRFGRPIKWVCALFGGQPLQTAVAGVLTGNQSHGHPVLSPGPFEVTDAAHWLMELRHHYVIADPGERRGQMLQQLRGIAENLGCDVGFDEELVDEVVNLVEWPKAMGAVFDEGLLDLPHRLLVESMKKNQRYFPLYQNGALTNRFLLVANNPFCDVRLVAVGNQRVLAARFHDARFFYSEDRKKKLEEHGVRLSGMTFIRGLGNMEDRQRRIAAAAVGLADDLGADALDVHRAGNLCKCDLVTTMVGEFPELQGHVGRLLAELDGESHAAAMAIEEHYLPRFAGDGLPKTPAGRALALAERLTLLADCFGLGIRPSSSADPQGLRRAALGLVQIVLDAGWPGDVRTLFENVGCKPEIVAELGEFVVGRLRASLLAEGHPADIIEAVLATGGARLLSITERVRAMGAMVQAGTFGPIRVTFRRAAGLVKEHTFASYQADRFVADVERDLHAALQQVEDRQEVASALSALLQLRPALDAFFDGVLVMSDDELLRLNRLGLLRAVTDRFAGIADFSRLSTE